MFLIETLACARLFESPNKIRGILLFLKAVNKNSSSAPVCPIRRQDSTTAIRSDKSVWLWFIFCFNRNTQSCRKRRGRRKEKCNSIQHCIANVFGSSAQQRDSNMKDVTKAVSRAKKASCNFLSHFNYFATGQFQIALLSTPTAAASVRPSFFCVIQMQAQKRSL